MELAVLRAKESVRKELEQQYKREIDIRDELLKLLRGQRASEGQ